MSACTPTVLHQSALMRWLRACSVGACVWAAVGGALAQSATDMDYPSRAQQWLREAVLASQPSGTSLRMEVSVGALDSRLKLAPCGNVEAYLPPGSRLWGRTRVGLRCVDSMARWNVSMPASVKAFGTAWVIRGQVQSGSVISESDVVEAPVDWAEDPHPVLRDRNLWVGQVATRTLSTGQTLRQDMVKPALAFQAGTQVRVVAQGAGFQISGDAQALSAGVVGQMARVKMENGRVATGTVLDTRTVQIDL